jgi:hypothetical protein
VHRPGEGGRRQEASESFLCSALDEGSALVRPGPHQDFYPVEIFCTWATGYAHQGAYLVRPKENGSFDALLSRDAFHKISLRHRYSFSDGCGTCRRGGGHLYRTRLGAGNESPLHGGCGAASWLGGLETDPHHHKYGEHFSFFVALPRSQGGQSPSFFPSFASRPIRNAQNPPINSPYLYFPSLSIYERKGTGPDHSEAIKEGLEYQIMGLAGLEGSRCLRGSVTCSVSLAIIEIHIGEALCSSP